MDAFPYRANKDHGFQGSLREIGPYVIKQHRSSSGVHGRNKHV